MDAVHLWPRPAVCCARPTERRATDGVALRLSLCGRCLRRAHTCATVRTIMQWRLLLRLQEGTSVMPLTAWQKNMFYFNTGEITDFELTMAYR